MEQDRAYHRSLQHHAAAQSSTSGQLQPIPLEIKYFQHMFPNVTVETVKNTNKHMRVYFRSRAWYWGFLWLTDPIEDPKRPLQLPCRVVKSARAGLPRTAT